MGENGTSLSEFCEFNMTGFARNKEMQSWLLTEGNEGEHRRNAYNKIAILLKRHVDIYLSICTYT